ncbi:MAG TPA: hypothetical protein ENJ09_04420 [Planctomycetes bacterium]|nr:hypothetical protein [Planctomycetota bacterium]
MLQELAPRVTTLRAAGLPGMERIVLRGERAYLKHGPLRGSAARRYGLADLLGRPTPRIREFDNLSWLRAHGFAAPEPLAARLDRSGLRASYQFLATREIKGARTLREELEASDAERCAALLASLGAEVARLHGAGFVHRDLFPRNVLVVASGRSPRFAFLDAWRGGPRPQPPGRGRTFDLACLTLYLPTLAGGDARRLLLESYSRSSPQREGTLRRIDACRARLISHLKKRGRTSPPLPDS